MLWAHFMQQWFCLSDPATEEAFFDTLLFREFAQLRVCGRLPDESSILRYAKTPSPRHRLEKHNLAEQLLKTVNKLLTRLMFKAVTLVDATLIAAPSCTKNQDRVRDPEMHQTKEGNHWNLGMKVHIGVDADSDLDHTVVGTAANVNDVTQASALVHSQETDVFADAGYKGLAKHEEVQSIAANWHVAMLRVNAVRWTRTAPCTQSWTNLNTSKPESTPKWSTRSELSSGGSDT